MRTSLALALAFALVAVATVARAQCPDGTLPPCRRAQRRLPELAARQQLAAQFQAARFEAQRRGDWTAARIRVCAGLTVLPESIPAWPVPPECSVQTVVQGAGSVQVCGERQWTPVGPTGSFEECGVGRDSVSNRQFGLRFGQALMSVGYFATDRDFSRQVWQAGASDWGRRFLRLVAGTPPGTVRHTISGTFPLPTRTVTATFEATPLAGALLAFADSELALVADPRVAGWRIAGRFDQVPWRDALEALLTTYGLYAEQLGPHRLRIRRWR